MSNGSALNGALIALLCNSTLTHTLLKNKASSISGSSLGLLDLTMMSLFPELHLSTSTFSLYAVLVWREMGVQGSFDWMIAKFNPFLKKKRLHGILVCGVQSWCILASILMAHGELNNRRKGDATDYFVGLGFLWGMRVINWNHFVYRI